MTATIADRWTVHLDRLRAKHRVPGVQLGVLRLGGGGSETSRLLMESGVLDVERATPVERDSAFQIGSISKVVTAATALRCAELGLLDLSAPIRTLLPGFRLADDAVARAVSMADLLCHRSGIEGERYRETGEDAAAVARYVDELADARQVHPLRGGFSYSNTAYVIAGRAIEVATGMPWAEAAAALVLRPLGLARVSAPTSPGEVRSPAIGHVIDADDRMVRAEPWRIPPGMAPAGMLTADVGAVLDLLACSLRRGTAADGAIVLSRASADALVEPAVATDVPGVDAWGLGWFTERWGDRAVFGHDGGTNGQFAFARAVPEAGIAFALLTNGGHARAFYEELMPVLAADTIDSPGPASPAPASGGAGPATGGAATVFPALTGERRYRNGDGDLILIPRNASGPLAAWATADAAANPSEFTPVLPAASRDGFVWQKPGERHWRTLVPLETERAVLLGSRRMRSVQA